MIIVIYDICIINIEVMARKAGWLYILGNEYMPCIYKIGLTGNLKKRKDGLYCGDSGVPYPFHIVDKVYVQDTRKHEKLIHKKLANDRINQRREFFGIRVYEKGDSPEDVINKKRVVDENVLKPVMKIFNDLRFNGGW
jgi:hypothetical protein